MILPTVDSILDSDRNSMMILHGGAIFIGILLLLRGNRSKDHEYLRSSAINRLNKIYNQEDAGLWSRADEALAKLETRKTKKRKGGKWSLKYKRSINCKKPKGFSQKQYCKRVQKRKRKTKKRRKRR